MSRREIAFRLTCDTEGCTAWQEFMTYVGQSPREAGWHGDQNGKIYACPNCVATKKLVDDSLESVRRAVI